MAACLRTLPQETVVVLHPCCHNPTGAELSTEQWDEVIKIVRERRLMMLAYDRRIYTNQMLVDRAGRHSALYVYPRHGLDERKTENFHAVYSLRNPDAVAENFLKLFDRFMAGKNVDSLLVS